LRPDMSILIEVCKGMIFSTTEKYPDKIGPTP
jgi:hypothetical protein